MTLLGGSDDGEERGERHPNRDAGPAVDGARVHRPRGGRAGGGQAITHANDLTRVAAAMAKVNQSHGLQWLQLQKAMLSQSRQSTTISNIMKLKHDVAKSVINNIR